MTDLLTHLREQELAHRDAATVAALTARRAKGGVRQRFQDKAGALSRRADEFGRWAGWVDEMGRRANKGATA